MGCLLTKKSQKFDEQTWVEQSTKDCLLTKKSQKFDQKIINDPIHGVIALHPLLMKIINTPQFARLKDIKQLGVSYWIFPGASHNRFEHSIGTSHLCGKMIDTLRDLHSTEENGKIEITDQEVLCVKVAGLCHDLGHGPFSHFFDMDYIPMVKSKEKQDGIMTKIKSHFGPFFHFFGMDYIPMVKSKEKQDGTTTKSKEKPHWTHEQASCNLFDFMLCENKSLNATFEKYGLKDQEKLFIKDLILGEKSKGAEEKTSTFLYKGADPNKTYKKSFLYEIVNNKRNGIDCDKFDYFARDCYNVGVQSNFDCQRYFHTTRIMPVGDELQICVRDKEVFNLYELLHTRSSLHQRVYQHKTEAPIHDMLAKALFKVDKKFGISSSITDMRRYTTLTDSIVYEILRSDSSDKETTDAKDLLLKIQNRELYKFCGETYLPQIDSEEPLFKSAEIEKAIKNELIAWQRKNCATCMESKNCENCEKLSDHIFVSVAVIDSNKKGKDPIKLVNFFDKSHKLVTFPEEQLKQMAPAVWARKIVRVYAMKPEYEEKVKECFATFCKHKGWNGESEMH